MCELLTGSRTLSQLADNRIDVRLIELIERATKQDPIYRFKTAVTFTALADLGGKPADDERTLVRLIAQMRTVGTNSPDAITPQTGSGRSGGNYFETIATLAKKRESERATFRSRATVDRPNSTTSCRHRRQQNESRGSSGSSEARATSR